MIVKLLYEVRNRFHVDILLDWSELWDERLRSPNGVANNGPMRLDGRL